MPLLASPKGRSDGGYAVADFRTVQEELGTMEDLEALADRCREKGISLCLDFVMNHTSEDHEWAKAAREGDELALACDIMLHAWMLTQSGIPVLYSGDEVGQLNDYTYHADPDKAADSRYVHRGGFDWDKAELRKDPEALQGKLFAGLRKLERIRSEEAVFRADARVSTFDTGSHQVLGVCRELAGERLTALFNFSERSIPVEMEACALTDLVEQKSITEERIELPAYGFYWLKSMK